MDVRAHDVRANGVTLRVWVWEPRPTRARRPRGAPGSGAPPGALLLHGIGNYGRFWDLVATEIAGRLRLVAPDARGHGDSEKPPAGYRAEDYIADALGVADALGLDRFVLVGHSMGGAHALALAATFPARVRALLVVDVGPELLPEGRERAYRLTATRPARFATEAAALSYLRETSPGYGDAVYENRIRWAFRNAGDGALEWRSSQDALLQTMGDRSRAGRLADLLPSIPCPTVVLRGTDSYVLGADAARRMVAAMPRARLVEVAAGHNVPLDRPRETAALIVELASV